MIPGIPVFLLMANLFFHRYLYTQWWLGQRGSCSFRGQWGETLENAIGGKLLGVNEIRSSWYGQHRWSSRWCYHCCSILEAGIWSDHFHSLNYCVFKYFTCSSETLDPNTTCGVLFSICIFFIILFNILLCVRVFFFSRKEGGRSVRMGHIWQLGHRSGGWCSHANRCLCFVSLLSEVLFNCSCYEFLKLELCFAVCWWEGSMDAYWPGWPSLEREETRCNRIWHCYFSGVGFEELFLDTKVEV